MDSRDREFRAPDLHAHGFVLDMTLPMLQNSDLSLFWAALERMRTSGYDYVSLTIAADHTHTLETLRNIVYLRSQLEQELRRRGIAGQFVPGGVGRPS